MTPEPMRLTTALEASLRRTLLPLLLAKLVTLAAFGALAMRYPEGFSHRSYVAVYRGNHGVPPREPPAADIVLRTWDAEHYLALASSGYASGGPKTAFYPLYPLLVRATTPVTGDPLAAALLLSNTLGLAALVLLHALVRRRHDQRVADVSLLLMAAQPAAFFLCLPYTESLFLLEFVLLLAALDEDRLLAAGIVSALACLTRPVGVLFLVPIAAHALVHPASRRRAVGACGLLLAGWASYFAILRAETGSATFGFEIQRQFIGAPSLARLLDPVGFVVRAFDVRRFHGFVGSALDRVHFLIALGLLVGLARRARHVPTERPWAAGALVLSIVPAVTAAFMSYTRYVSVVVPLHVEAARRLARARRPLLWVTLAVLLALQGMLLVRHGTHRWAG